MHICVPRGLAVAALLALASPALAHDDELRFVPLPDGRVATIIRLTYGRARIHAQQTVDDDYFGDGW